MATAVAATEFARVAFLLTCDGALKLSSSERNTKPADQAF